MDTSDPSLRPTPAQLALAAVQRIQDNETQASMVRLEEWLFRNCYVSYFLLSDAFPGGAFNPSLGVALGMYESYTAGHVIRGARMRADCCAMPVNDSETTHIRGAIRECVSDIEKNPRTKFVLLSHVAGERVVALDFGAMSEVAAVKQLSVALEQRIYYLTWKCSDECLDDEEVCLL